MVQVNELGYRAWEEKASPTFRGWFVIAQTGCALAWKSGWVRRIMFFAGLPTLFLALSFFFYEQAIKNPAIKMNLANFFMSGPIPSPEVAAAIMKSPEDARHMVWSYLLLTFFRLPQGIAMVLIVGLIAPRLIAQDVRSRAFLLYFSRPIDVSHYVLGKSAIVWAFLMCITTLPALALYVGGILMSPNFSVITSTWDLPFRILLASCVLIVPTTALALCFSSLTTDSRNAGFLWFATWILGWVAFSTVQVANIRPGNLQQDIFKDSHWTLLSPYHTLGKLQTWIFGMEAEFTKIFPSALAVFVVTLVALAVLFRRVTAPLRV